MTLYPKLKFKLLKAESIHALKQAQKHAGDRQNLQNSEKFIKVKFLDYSNESTDKHACTPIFASTGLI